MMNKINSEFNSYRKDKGISSVTLNGYCNIMNKQYPNFGYVNPTIIEERQLNVAQMDVFSRLMMDRIVFLGTAINDDVSNIITAQLLFLNSIDSEKPINLYINSPGGGIYSGYSILDTMDFISNKVNTMVTGMAASMSYVISISGDDRCALKHSRLMQHQPLGGASGQASDILIVSKQIEILKNELYEIISKKTGQSIEKIQIDADRDYWMTAKEAKEYGAIDKIIGID